MDLPNKIRLPWGISLLSLLSLGVGLLSVFVPQVAQASEICSLGQPSVSCEIVQEVEKVDVKSPVVKTPVVESSNRDESDDVQKFQLSDGSVVSVNYKSSKVSIELGYQGPVVSEEFAEGDFGGIFWDWGQVTPLEDGTWYYEDWLDEGFESSAQPLSTL